MEMDLHKWATVGVGIFGVISTLFVFVVGREFFRLDKWKEDTIRYFTSELSRIEAYYREFKKEVALNCEAHKTWTMKEFDKLTKYDTEYRKNCVLNMYSEIKRLNGDSKHDAKEIGKLMGDHRYLENVVDNIRQFYEENRSLLDDKVALFQKIAECHKIMDEKFTALEAKIREIDIIRNTVNLLDVEGDK